MNTFITYIYVILKRTRVIILHNFVLLYSVYCKTLHNIKFLFYFFVFIILIKKKNNKIQLMIIVI